MHVVIVDPSRVVQSKLAIELEAAGCDVDCFSTSDLALQHVSNCRSVDVVITSLELEPVPGLELCWMLRTVAGSTRPLHVIVMSSNTSERALSESLDCGADDFVVKPVGREELKARLRAANRIITLQRQLIEQSRTDPLTGLLNRRAFTQEVEARRRELDPGDEFSICICDVDDFKHVNDTYGHDVGDEAIKLVGRLACEEAPIVARLGGDEFAFAFPVLDAAQAAHWSDVIRQNIEKTEVTTPDGRTFKFTCSIGVAQWNGNESLSAVMKRADMALLEVKAGGNNHVIAKTSDAALSSAA